MSALAAAAGLWLGAIVVTGAYLDMRYRRLPNWLCAIALASGLGFVLADAGWDSASMSFIHALLAVMVGACLFALGGIGAGDAKYYAALASWFPLREAILLLAVVSLAGLVLLVIWLPWRMKLANPERMPPPRSGFDKLPYGVAISSGTAVAFLLTR